MTSRTGTAISLEDLRIALQQPLALVDPDRRSEFQAYIDAAIPHLERAVLDQLARMIEAFNTATADVTAHLELSPRGATISFDAGSEPPSGSAFSDSDIERLTLRLPKRLKQLIDTEADRQGVSANSWYVHHLARSLRRQLRHGDVGMSDLSGPPRDEDASSGSRRGNAARRSYRGRLPGERS
jgi:hypothetical protein